MNRRCGSPGFRLLIATALLTSALFFCIPSPTSANRASLETPRCLLTLEAVVSLRSTNPNSETARAVVAGIRHAHESRGPLCLLGGGRTLSVFINEAGDSTLWGASDPRARTISLVERTLAHQSQQWIDGIVGHELAHIALANKVAPEAIPAWFSEGVANAVGRSVRCRDSSDFSRDLPINSRSTNSPELRAWFVRRLIKEDRFTTESFATFIFLKLGYANLEPFWRSIAHRGFAPSLQLFLKVDTERLIQMWIVHVLRQLESIKPLTTCA